MKETLTTGRRAVIEAEASRARCLASDLNIALDNLRKYGCTVAFVTSLAPHRVGRIDVTYVSKETF